jgi:hypothetical protein
VRSFQEYLNNQDIDVPSEWETAINEVYGNHASKRQKMTDTAAELPDEAMENANVETAGDMHGSYASTTVTPVVHQPPSLGLPNVHTAILPLTIWFSMNGGLKTGPNDFIVSMVQPLAGIKTAIAKPADGAALVNGAAWKPIADSSSTTYIANSKFPETSGSNVTPGWWNYYAKQYLSFAPIGCHWKLIVSNPGGRGTNDVLMNMNYETWSADNDQNKLPTGTPFSVAHQWKHNHWTLIEGNREAGGTGNASGRYYEVIEGHYRPGQAHRMALNDGDVKVWTDVGDVNPLNEDLHLQFYPAPLTSGLTPVKINCQLEVKWIVQFRDAVSEIDYPYYGDATPVLVSLPTDELAIYDP